MTAASQGAFSKLAMDPDGTSTPTFDAGSERYEFLSETLSRTGIILNPNGLRGDRSQQAERSRQGTNVNSGIHVGSANVSHEMGWGHFGTKCPERTGHFEAFCASH